MMLGSAESQPPKLTNRGIILKEFQPMRLITIPQTHGRTNDFAVAIPRSGREIFERPSYG